MALWNSHRSGHAIIDRTNAVELISFGPSTFMMGRPMNSTARAAEFDQNAAQPEHQLSLSAFSVGKYPITVDQYCDFLNAVGFHPEFTVNRALLQDFVEKPKGAFKPIRNHAFYPVRNVTLAGAKAYCDWASKISCRKCTLPTEAEWEFVAKGVQGRTYPWGEADRFVRFRDSKIGEHPQLATPEGVQDLNGPVYQYCLDLFDPDFYKRSPAKNPVCTNGNWPVVRGGPMFRFMEKLRMPATWKRFHSGDETEADVSIGFRIVVEEPEQAGGEQGARRGRS